MAPKTVNERRGGHDGDRDQSGLALRRGDIPEVLEPALRPNANGRQYSFDWIGAGEDVDFNVPRAALLRLPNCRAVAHEAQAYSCVSRPARTFVCPEPAVSAQ